MGDRVSNVWRLGWGFGVFRSALRVYAISSQVVCLFTICYAIKDKARHFWKNFLASTVGWIVPKNSRVSASYFVVRGSFNELETFVGSKKTLRKVVDSGKS